MIYAKRIDTAYREIRENLEEQPDESETFHEVQTQFIRGAPFLLENSKALLSTCSLMRQLITVAEQEFDKMMARKRNDDRRQANLDTGQMNTSVRDNLRQSNQYPQQNPQCPFPKRQSLQQNPNNQQHYASATTYISPDHNRKPPYKTSLRPPKMNRISAKLGVERASQNLESNNDNTRYFCYACRQFLNHPTQTCIFKDFCPKCQEEGHQDRYCKGRQENM
jgi:hypothetical protein